MIHSVVPVTTPIVLELARVASSSSALQGFVMWLGCRSVGDAGRLSYLLGSPGLRYLCMQPTSVSGSSIPLLI